MKIQCYHLVCMALGVISFVCSEVVTNDDLIVDGGSRNFSLTEQITQRLDFFNVHRLAENWLVINDLLGPNCSRNMMQYLQGLQEHTAWAMKSKFDNEKRLEKKLTFYFIHPKHFHWRISVVPRKVFKITNLCIVL